MLNAGVLTFQEFAISEANSGAVNDALVELGASDQDLASWYELVAQEIKVPNEDSKFD
jgi:hypothetical protein